MDPVSLLGTVAGVAAAAASLSLSLYDLASQIKHAPKEMIAIAEEMQLFSSILNNLQDHLAEHKELFKPKIYEVTEALVSRLRAEQEAVLKMTKLKTQLFRVRWAFKKSQATDILIRIHGLKASLNVVLQVANMPISLAHHKLTEPATSDEKSQVSRLKKVIEAAVEANRRTVGDMEEKALRHRQHMLKKLEFKERELEEMGEGRFAHHSESRKEEIKQLRSEIDYLNGLPSVSRDQHPIDRSRQLHIYSGPIRDMATFLYNLVFNPPPAYTEATSPEHDREEEDHHDVHTVDYTNDGLEIEEVISNAGAAADSALLRPVPFVERGAQPPTKDVEQVSGPTSRDFVLPNRTQVENKHEATKEGATNAETNNKSVVYRLVRDWTTIAADLLTEDDATNSQAYVEDGDESNTDGIPVDSLEARLDSIRIEDRHRSTGRVSRSANPRRYPPDRRYRVRSTQPNAGSASKTIISYLSSSESDDYRELYETSRRKRDSEGRYGVPPNRDSPRGAKQRDEDEAHKERQRLEALHKAKEVAFEKSPIPNEGLNDPLFARQLGDGPQPWEAYNSHPRAPPPDPYFRSTFSGDSLDDMPPPPADPYSSYNTNPFSNYFESPPRDPLSSYPFYSSEEPFSGRYGSSYYGRSHTRPPVPPSFSSHHRFGYRDRKAHQNEATQRKENAEPMQQEAHEKQDQSQVDDLTKKLLRLQEELSNQKAKEAAKEMDFQARLKSALADEQTRLAEIQRRVDDAEERLHLEKIDVLYNMLDKVDQEIVPHRATLKSEISSTSSNPAVLEHLAIDRIAMELRNAFRSAKENAHVQASKQIEDAHTHNLGNELSRRTLEIELRKLRAAQPEPVILFTDATGRTYNLPYAVCKTWAAMEDLIQKCCMHDHVLVSYVRKGQYDLIGPTGGILLPQVWETTVQPSQNIKMQIWSNAESPVDPQQWREANRMSRASSTSLYVNHHTADDRCSLDPEAERRTSLGGLGEHVSNRHSPRRRQTNKTIRSEQMEHDRAASQGNLQQYIRSLLARGVLQRQASIESVADSTTLSHADSFAAEYSPKQEESHQELRRRRRRGGRRMRGSAQSRGREGGPRDQPVTAALPFTRPVSRIEKPPTPGPTPPQLLPGLEGPGTDFQKAVMDTVGRGRPSIKQLLESLTKDDRATSPQYVRIGRAQSR